MQENSLPHKVRKQVKRSLGMSLSQLNFVATFIEDMLSLSLSKNGQLSLVNQPFNPKQVFMFILSMFRPLMPPTGPKLEFEVVSCEAIQSLFQTGQGEVKPSPLLLAASDQGQ
mmetsp:Transcript_43765/g.58055  ORF Transcript_43765/g.58055 Transcript_43765/m.58055 type:complete len:113 (-) Transcript_43765:1097-1435(-)